MRERTVSSLIKDGNRFYDNQDYEKALVYYNLVLKKFPDQIYAWFGKWLVLKKQGHLDKASECFNKLCLIASGARGAKFWNDKGSELFYKNDFENALISYDKAIELKPTEANYWNNKACTLDERGDYENALVCCNKAIKLKPKEAVYWNHKGYISKKKHDYDNALFYYDEAIKLKPKEEADYWNCKGEVYRSKGDYENALICYDKAIKLKPKRVDFWYMKGEVLDEIGDYQNALACYNKAIEIKPSHADDWNSKANAYRSKGDYENALECYSKALKLQPKVAAYWNNRGNAFNDKGEYEKALVSYDEAIKLKPIEALYWNNKGNTLRNKGDYKNALICYDKAIELKSKNVYYWNNKSIVLFFQAQYQEAARHYEQALLLNPQSAFTLQTKGIDLFRQEQVKEATQLLEQAEQALIQKTKAKSVRAELFAVRSELFLAIQAFSEAILALEMALSYNPHFAWTKQKLADLKSSQIVHDISGLLAQGKQRALGTDRVQLIFENKQTAEALLLEIQRLSDNHLLQIEVPPNIAVLPSNPNNNNDSPCYALEFGHEAFQALQCYASSQHANVSSPSQAANTEPVEDGINSSQTNNNTAKFNPLDTIDGHRDEIFSDSEDDELILSMSDDHIEDIYTTIEEDDSHSGSVSEEIRDDSDDSDELNEIPMVFEPSQNNANNVKNSHEVKTVHTTSIDINNNAISSTEVSLTKPSTEIPDDYICPITKTIMFDPVCIIDGTSYEREAITRWLMRDKKIISPLTGEPLKNNYICPNNYLKQQINLFIKDHPQVSATHLIDIIKQDTLDEQKIIRSLWLGAQLEAKDEEGRTALHWAVDYGDNETVLLLLKRGINPDCGDIQGQTPLHVAAQKGRETIAQLLLHHQAKITLTDKFGKTALDYAQIYNHRNMIMFLKNHMEETRWVNNSTMQMNSTPELRWVRNLTFSYKTDFLISADNHYRLRERVYQAETAYKHNNANFVAMQLGFLYTHLDAKKHHQNPYHHFHSFDISNQKNFIHVSTEYQGQGENFLHDLIRYHPSKEEKIRKEYNQTNKFNFYLLFHHSERGLFKHLENADNLNKYINNFANELKKQHNEIPQGFHIKMAVLDLHSSHYLCKWCEPALQYFQSRESFFSQMLQVELREVGFEVSENFYIASRYSAEKPASQQKTREANEHAPEHEIVELKDYRKKQIPLILQRDDFKTLGRYQASTIAPSIKPANLKPHNSNYLSSPKTSVINNNNASKSLSKKTKGDIKAPNLGQFYKNSSSTIYDNTKRKSLHNDSINGEDNNDSKASKKPKL